MLCGTFAHAEWKFSGYTQARYNMWDEATDEDSFDLRRVRIKAEGTVSDETAIKLQFDLSGLDDDQGEIELKDALITRTFSDTFKGAIGYTSVPFGYEVPTSSSKRLPLERSEVARRFFPGERATGAWVMYHPKASGSRPMVDLGYTNGMSKWYDTDSNGNEDDDSEAYFARAQMPINGKGMVGVSYMSAKRHRNVGEDRVTFDGEDVFGAHVRWEASKQFAAQGEYYTGEMLGTDVDGWYGMAEFALPQTPVTVFYRYDTCDRSQAHDYERHTVGAAWDVSKNDRVTVQAEDIQNYNGNGLVNCAVQYQAKY
jgi:phosphate-selective porin